MRFGRLDVEDVIQTGEERFWADFEICWWPASQLHEDPVLYSLYTATALWIIEYCVWESI